MTMSEAANVILSDTDQPMHVKDLVREIEARELFKFGAKNPASVLAGALNKKVDTFTKVGPGIYSLR